MNKEFLETDGVVITPLAIDLFCGLGGWTEGLLAEGYYVVGFDVERHRYPKYPAIDSAESGEKSSGGSNKLWRDRVATGPRDNAIRHFRSCATPTEWLEYPAQLVLQDVLTLHGSQFKDASLIVASPPCQEYSYMAMPWSRAKAIAAEYRSGVRDVKKLTALFDACFRIQREACEASGRHIPLVVENVRGAIPWVGRSRWNFGSFHLWGDVPALMPMTAKRHATDGSMKCPSESWSPSRPSFTTDKGWKDASEHIKQGGDWFNAEQPSISRMCGSKSPARKAASAMIASIPSVLARYIARVYRTAL